MRRTNVITLYGEFLDRSLEDRTSELLHEIVHVEQQDNGGRPRTYKEVNEREAEAYRKQWETRNVIGVSHGERMNALERWSWFSEAPPACVVKKNANC